ncbi:DUF2243 domain-containing protein [Pantanalinema rosaneae CENA516]|uniref:DUF2243 domain-containing protein n=1 Tax=Pantanalinema rosaneae TaxID=1620701 RepID=UPI003D6F3EF7
MTQSVTSSTSTSVINRRPLITAGIVLGCGQAGFFDGIIFHQLLQWHHMFSNIKSDATVAGLELNTLGDGLFHLFDWSMTLLGIFLLWRAAKQTQVLSAATFIGSLMIGFGLFNCLEGLIDHQILGIHHVRSGTYTLIYDLSYLGISGLIALIGWVILQSDQRKTSA